MSNALTSGPFQPTPAFERGDQVEAIGNVSHEGQRGVVREVLQGNNQWFLVRFQDGTDDVYERADLQIAALRPKDSGEERCGCFAGI